jgi:hypothetical protein
MDIAWIAAIALLWLAMAGLVKAFGRLAGHGGTRS